METNERIVLQNAKLGWRRKMRAKYGDGWTKSKSSLMRSDGQRRMN